MTRPSAGTGILDSGTTASRATGDSNRIWRWVLAAAALLAVAGLWAAAAADQPRTVADQTRHVAETLRCPTCVGENVADSTAPVAEAMRTVIAGQLDEGRSGDEIRAWFVDRYGTNILLDPGSAGMGWLLWAVPLVLAGLAVLLLARNWRLRRRLLTAGVAVALAAAATAPWTLAEQQQSVAEPAAAVDAAVVLEQAAADNPGDADLRLALGQVLLDSGRSADAAEQFAAAARLRPHNADIGYRHAAALLDDGRTADAAAVLEGNLERHPDHQATLLLYGTVLVQAGQDRGVQLLEQFLQLAPDHPAAGEVRQLLGEAE